MSVVPARTDGRNARTERTRRAVVEAMLSLIDGGDLRPTAKRVAERANISLRSVFQHFADLESLFAAVADAQQGRLAWLISLEPGEGPLGERLRSFVERRAKLLETITPVRRAALLQEPFSEELGRRLRRAHDMARNEIERTFAPELAGVTSGDAREIVFALDVATNWSAWDTSRRLNRLSIGGSKRVMERTIIALLKETA
jgi:TetR/AcrR family transcriptional regulator, regulator of autoinduction and epiphytic fitness